MKYEWSSVQADLRLWMIWITGAHARKPWLRVVEAYVSYVKFCWKQSDGY